MAQPSPEDHQEPAYFNWTKQWYPLQVHFALFLRLQALL